MNYIWEPLIHIMQQGDTLVKLSYQVQRSRVSPYLELQPDSLYEEAYSKDSFAMIDVNPYLRFESIFEQFITPDNLGYEEFNEGFGDVLLHYLADLDLKSGMCKREFYLKFLISDLEKGVFGGIEDFERFSVMEKRVLAEGIFTLYQTLDYFACIMETASKLFPFCQVFIRDLEEIVFYMREERTEDSEGKISFLIRLLLPLTVSYVVHWTKTYGVAGYDNTMNLGEFIL